jgi:hypothetical protein
VSAVALGMAPGVAMGDDSLQLGARKPETGQRYRSNH